MIKYLIPILMFCCSPAWADWSYLNKVCESSLYIDPLSARSGTRPRVWALQDYGHADEYGDWSAKLLLEANCSDRTLRQLSGVFFKEAMGRGATTSEYQPTDWAAPAAGSIDLIALQFLCGVKP